MDSSFSENDILIIITMGIIVMLLMALALGLFFYFSQKRFQAQQLAAQEKDLLYSEQLLFNSIQAQEKERQRIARELHDAVGSKLNVINLGLHRLQKAVGDTAVAAETVRELFNTVGNTIDTTRRISHDLLPPTLENFGLAVALQELCETAQQTAGISLEFELCDDSRPDVDSAIAISIFRVVQELLSNTLKYAAASLIQVKLWQGQKQIKLTYGDNGKGFDQGDEANKKGMGMRNIESRLRMVGANYSLESAPGKGMFFQLKKPLT